MTKKGLDNWIYGVENYIKDINRALNVNKIKEGHEWYPISIEHIKCERCWYCGKTRKILN